MVVGVDDGNSDSDEVEDLPERNFGSPDFRCASELWSTDRALGRCSEPPSLVNGLLVGSDLKKSFRFESFRQLARNLV